jgi:hypothetical protein
MITARPNFVDSKHVKTQPIFVLADGTPDEIHTIYRKYTSGEQLNKNEMRILYTSKYINRIGTKWIANPGAPQEIVDEIKQFYNAMESWKINE